MFCNCTFLTVYDVFIDSVESPNNGDDDEGCIDIPSGRNCRAMHAECKGMYMYNTCTVTHVFNDHAYNELTLIANHS